MGADRPTKPASHTGNDGNAERKTKFYFNCPNILRPIFDQVVSSFNINFKI